MFTKTLTFLQGIRSAIVAGVDAYRKRTVPAANNLSQQTPQIASPYDNLWKYAALNPHLVVNPLRDSNAEDLGRAVGLYRQSDAFVSCVNQIRESYKRASELLLSDPRVAAKFPSAIPLAYALYPKLEPMDEDDLGSQKFGGIPDFRHAYWLNHIRKEGADKIVENPTFDQLFWELVEHWPICGACHRPMKFIAQIDLSDWGMALHALTSEGHGDHGDRWRSGLGLTRHFGSSAHRAWWYLFACPDSSSHFDNPDSDARVVIEHRLIPFKCVINGVDLGHSDEPKVNSETMIELVRQFYRSQSAYSVSSDQKTLFKKIFEHDDRSELDLESGLMVEPQKIVGFEIGWEFDSGICAGYELNEVIQEIIDENPDVFGSGSGFRLFGAPVSQQEERRYWTVRGFARSGGALRMAPLLSFHDSGHDMTYQIYADTLGDFYGHGMYGKVDASCT